jgi:hypothetical protein
VSSADTAGEPTGSDSLTDSAPESEEKPTLPADSSVPDATGDLTPEPVIVTETTSHPSLLTAGEYVSVKDYGAAGDGVTDDSAACQKAFSEAQLKNLPLYLPAGTYNMNGQSLGMARKPILMIGDGPEKTVLLRMRQLYCLNSLNLSDFAIAESSGYLFYISPESNFTISIQNVTCTGSDNINNSGFLYVEDKDGYRATSVEITGCYVRNVDLAVRINSYIDYAHIASCTFENLGTILKNDVCGIILGYDKRTTADNVLIDGNTIRNLYTSASPKTDDITKLSRGYGILVYGSNIVISNNHIENILGGDGHTAIYTKSPNAQIINNTIINAGDGGGCIVNKMSATTNSVISGNRIYADNAPSETSFYNGILFKGTNVIIENNDITLTVGGILMQVYNDDGYNYESVTINNNVMTANGYYVVYGSSWGGNIDIIGNQIYHNNTSNEEYPATFALSSVTDQCVIDFTGNSIQTTNASIIKSWNCSSSAIINLEGNTFSDTSSSLFSFGSMTVNAA